MDGCDVKIGFTKDVWNSAMTSGNGKYFLP
jgi:hypothetical protein